MSPGWRSISLRDKLQNTTVVIVAHRVFPSIVDDLKKYLLDNHCGELWYIIHEFSTLKTRRSFIEHYRGGELVGTHYGFDYRFIPDPCVNIKDFLYSIHRPAVQGHARGCLYPDKRFREAFTNTTTLALLAIDCSLAGTIIRFSS